MAFLEWIAEQTPKDQKPRLMPQSKDEEESGYWHAILAAHIQDNLQAHDSLQGLINGLRTDIGTLRTQHDGLQTALTERAKGWSRDFMCAKMRASKFSND